MFVRSANKPDFQHHGLMSQSGNGLLLGVDEEGDTGESETFFCCTAALLYHMCCGCRCVDIYCRCVLCALGPRLHGCVQALGACVDTCVRALHGRDAYRSTSLPHHYYYVLCLPRVWVWGTLPVHSSDH